MKITYWDLFYTFFRIGLFSFGGGYTMLPLLQKEIVKKKWITVDELYDYYALAQTTPGIIAVNLSIFVGLKIKGVFGAIVALIGTILPAFTIICLLATGLSFVWKNPWVRKALRGIQLIVPALIIPILFTITKKSIIDKISVFILITAFCFAFLRLLPPIATILLFVLFSLLYRRKQT